MYLAGIGQCDNQSSASDAASPRCRPYYTSHLHKPQRKYCVKRTSPGRRMDHNRIARRYQLFRIRRIRHNSGAPYQYLPVYRNKRVRLHISTIGLCNNQSSATDSCCSRRRHHNPSDMHCRHRHRCPWRIAFSRYMDHDGKPRRHDLHRYRKQLRRFRAAAGKIHFYSNKFIRLHFKLRVLCRNKSTAPNTFRTRNPEHHPAC